ncbi:hypothetical protein EVAR_30005_1 [Eumeta japonica]|uniref:Uncharacterized protein n=1 Tax=Eumeta variegata TaxID=151549 RepID=A0A4C1VVF0_EUMVA|nr:hypothetical protein EVAR_30005_1 [Eumeta japonica]
MKILNKNGGSLVVKKRCLVESEGKGFGPDHKRIDRLKSDPAAYIGDRIKPSVPDVAFTSVINVVMSLKSALDRREGIRCTPNQSKMIMG